MQYFEFVIKRDRGVESSFTTDDPVLCAMLETAASDSQNLPEILLVFAKAGIEMCDHSFAKAVETSGGIAFKYTERS